MVRTLCQQKKNKIGVDSINPYSFILDEMQWSFSRLSTYERCSYNFYLDYIKKVDKTQNGFAQYGTFVHELLEKYAKGELLIFELLDKYQEDFTKNVTCDFPPNAYVDLADTYYQGGLEYFTSFEGFDKYKIIEAEKEVKFKIDKYNFIGYIDLLIENENGEIEIIDHKSKDLKKPQKSKWNDVAKRRDSELYHYLRQLYIYCIPIIEQEKITPKYLNFNCFRKQNWIRVPFDIEDYKESKKWALDIINQIYADETMTKVYNKDFFCNHICGVNSYCPSSNKFLGEIV